MQFVQKNILDMESLILDQLTNGVAVPMALLYPVAGGLRDADAD